MHAYIQKASSGDRLCGIVDGNIVISEFKLQSHFFFTFTLIPWERYELTDSPS